MIVLRNDHRARWTVDHDKRLPRYPYWYRGNRELYENDYHPEAVWTVYQDRVYCWTGKEIAHRSVIASPRALKAWEEGTDHWQRHHLVEEDYRAWFAEGLPDLSVLLGVLAMEELL